MVDFYKERMKDKHFYFSIIFSMFFATFVNYIFHVVEQNFEIMFLGVLIGTFLIDIPKIKEYKLRKSNIK